MKFLHCLAEGGHDALVKLDSIKVIKFNDYGNVIIVTNHGEFTLNKKKEEGLREMQDSFDLLRILDI